MPNKYIIVLGASRGIGKALVELLAQNKDLHIIALARNIEKMKADFAALINVSSFAIDLNTKGVRAQLTQILQEFPNIDFFINNAGFLVNKPFLELNEEDIAQAYQVNTLSSFASIQAVLPKMLENGGHIVNISSIGGFQGSVKFGGLSAYSTSKAALVSLTELLAEEYKETKVKINCLCLGAVQTEMLEEAFPGYKAPLSADKMAEYIADFTLNQHQWMNGKVIPVSLSTP